MSRLSDMKNNETRIERLTENNYSTWKIVTTALLKSKGVYKYCVTKSESDFDEDDMILDETAKTWIYSSMTAAQIAATGECETAFELWNKVKENYEGAESDARSLALSRVLGFPSKKNESIIAYCGRFEQALGALSASGYKMDDKTKMWAFSKNLSKEMRHEVNTWVTVHGRDKFTQLISHLKTLHHSEHSNKEEDNVALYTGRPSQKNNNPKSNFKRSNNYNRDQRSGQQANTDNGKHCTYCKNAGHTWQECRKLKNDNGRKKHFGQNRNNQNGNNRTGNQQNGSDQAGNQHNGNNQHVNNQNVNNTNNNSSNQSSSKGHGAMTAAYRSEGATKPFTTSDNSWIIDSGATSHMTALRNRLVNYIDYPEPKKIVLGNGEPTEAYGEGEYYFNSSNYKGKLTEVLWVPAIAENLFSVSHAMEHECETRFTSNPPQAKIYRNGQQILQGKYFKNRLFTLQLYPENIATEFAGTTIEQWHKRFAHCSTNAIKELASKNAVLGLKITNEEKEQCQNCAFGKICRAHHPSRMNIKASSDSAVLNIDTCGPISTTSLGGSKYFVLATEEYSNYKMIEFASSKTQIPDIVKRFITLTKLTAGRPVHMIVTDNGTEYKNENLNSFLNENGIIHSYSTAYTPQQNGSAERANRTIIEATRTLLHDSNLSEELWAEAANYAVYTTNRLIGPRDSNKTRYELLTGKKPDVSNMKTFGETAVVRLPDEKRDTKFSPKGKLCRLVGYTERSNTYRFYDPITETVTPACDAKFLNLPGSIDIKSLSIDNNENVIFIHGNPTSVDSIINKKNKPVEPEVSIREESIDIFNNNPERRPLNSTTESQTSTGSTIIQQQNSTPIMQNDSTLTDNRDDSSEVSSDSSTESYESAMGTSSRVLRSGDKSQLVKDPKLPRQFWNNGNVGRATVAYFTLNDEPRTLKDAQESPDWPKWKVAMDEEIAALHKNNTWTLVPRPRDARPIKNKWVFKIKPAVDNQPMRYKARLVAKGYSQIPNIDYKETFAPVASMNSIRMIFAIANQRNMEIVQFDVKTAFLYGDLNETIYMEHPEGYNDGEDRICKLNKSLYGLKQAPRQWNVKFDTFLKTFNLEQSKIDRCIYYNTNRTMILAIYVDDGIVISEDKKLLDKLIDFLKQNFELKVMNCESYLGFRVTRDRKNGTLMLHQLDYIEKVIEKFGMTDCKPCSTPEQTGPITIENDEPLTEEYPFKELIGSLLYMVTCTRPDIAHAVSIASRTSTPTQVHWKRLKQILRYLRGTQDIGISFRWEKSPKLIGYSDADYANDVETRRSTTGYCIMYGGGPIAWRCQRQDIVTLSTTEAEYVSGCELVKELLPMREMFIELGQLSDEPTIVRIDNLSAVRIAKNDGGQQRTKHIDVREKWLNEQHEKKKIAVEHIPGTEQAADMLTKPLLKTKFIANRNMLLKSITMIAHLGLIMSIFITADCRRLNKVKPLMLTKSDIIHFDGDDDILLNIQIMNPCRHIFQAATVFSDKERSNLTMVCRNDYRAIVVAAFHNCNFENDNTLYNKTTLKDVLPHITANAPTKRVKRVAPLLVVIGASIVAGMSALSLGLSIRNTETEFDTENFLQKTLNIQDEAVVLFGELRHTLHNLKSWSPEVEKRLSSIDASNKHRAFGAALINFYLETMTQQSKILNEVSKELEKKKISPKISHFMNETLWNEKAPPYSEVKGCNWMIKDESLLLLLRFTMPTIDPHIHILETVPMDFYNKTENGTCWMKYNGPKMVMYNDSSSCLQEITEYTYKSGIVRYTTCETERESISGEELYKWKQDSCEDEVHPHRQRIQARSINGMHKIYCYPFNITIDDKTTPCPDYPFELDSSENYRIANIHHLGRQVKRMILSQTDIKRSEEIVKRIEREKMTHVMNLTMYDQTYFNLMEKVNQLHGHLTNIKDHHLPGWISNSIKWVDDFSQMIGIILLLVIVTAIAILISPIIQIILIIYNMIRNFVLFYFKFLKKLSMRWNYNLSKHKKRYWEKNSQLEA